MAANIHIGDVGTLMRVTIYDQDNAAIDLSGVIVKKILLRKPNGQVVEKTALFNTNGTDGKLKYTTLTGDIDVAGAWKLQGYIEGTTTKWHSDIVEFTVDGNLN